jgi:hypothetical protein
MRVGPLPTGLDKLERELKKLADAVVEASENGTGNKAYTDAVSRYNAKLAELNRERGKAGLNPIKSLDDLEEEKATAGTTTDVTRLENQLKAQQALGNTQKVKDLETRIAEANAMRTASTATPSGVKGVSQAGTTGYVPDITKSTPIINEDGSISIVGVDRKPIAVGNRNLQDVYIVFEEKNFYERGVKSTVKNVDYRTSEELRQQAFSLDKAARKKLQEEFKKAKLLPSNYNANGELDRDNAFENAFLAAHAYANQVNYNRLVNGQSLVGIIDAVKEYKVGEEKGAGPQVSRGISEFSLSDGDAANILEEFYTQALGVRPKADDIEKFKEIVKKRAAKRPRITQTTTTTDGDVTTTSGKVIEEGFGLSEAQRLARRQAEARPEFAPYQMATTFYDAVLRAAQSPTRIPGPTG